MDNDEDRKRIDKERRHAYYLANKEEWCARTNRNRRKRKLDPEYREKERVKRRERTASDKIKFKEIGIL